MGAPFNDIGINPPVSDRRRSVGCVATGAGITYGAVVKRDSGTTNFRDTKIAAGANDSLIVGVCQDQGDPNNSGQFAVGDEFGAAIDGDVEILIDTVLVHKGKYGCTSATNGTVKEDTGTGDVVCQFMQDYDNSAGTGPVLVSARMALANRKAEP